MKKRLFCLLIALILCISCMPFAADAATSLPDSIYLYPTMGGQTCTLVSAAMMHRACMYLHGASNWSSVTEYSIYDIAWVSGVGLRAGWTFSINGNSMSVARTGVSGISTSSLKDLLDAHPEGIVLYSGSLYHAVFLTDYEGDTFYCADPYGGNYSGRRLALANSYLGALAGGSQSNVLRNITAYWYISGSNFVNVNPPVNLGDSFYGSISRADSPNERLSVAEEQGGSLAFAAHAAPSAQQRWLFTRQTDGSYIIQSVHSGYVLNVDNGSSNEGTLATVWKDLGNNHQRWFIYEVDGAYKLTAKSTGKALTIPNSSSGPNATLNSYSGSAEQKLNIHAHTYQSENVISDCLQAGYIKYICTDCGDFYTVSDGSTVSGHSWEVSGYVPATCQELGKAVYTCTACGETYTEQAETIWSEWSEAYPEEVAPNQIETAVLYRYRDCEKNWGEAKSCTLDYVASWPSGFYTSNALYSQYNKTPVVDAETDGTRTRVLSSDTVGYIYYHWCRGTYTSGPINRIISDVAEGQCQAFHAFYSTHDAGHTDASGVYVADAFYYHNAGCCTDSYWYFQIPVTRQTYSVEEKQFDGERWSAWSDWSNIKPETMDSRQIEEKTVYRYATEGFAEHSFGEWTSVEAGLERRDCANCDHFETREVEIVKPDTPKLSVSGDSSSGKPKLKWDKVENAEKYQIYRKIGKNGTYKKLATVTGTSHIDKTAEAGIKYYYRIRAVAADGTKSDYCSGKARTCDLAKPVVEESNVSSSGAIKLEWDKIEGAEKYKIYRRVGKSGDYKYYKTTSKNEYTDKSTTPGKVYYYKVLAVHSNTSANSAKSSGVGQTCKLPRPEVEESNVSSSGKIKLEWEAIDDAVEYKIYRASSKSGKYTKIATTEKTTYTDKTAVAGKVYYYKIKAVHSNSSANSAYSSVVSQTCKLARTDVSITLSSGNPKLTWDEVDGAKEYKIYRATSKDGTYKLVKTTTSEKFTDKSVTAGKTYYYKVKAIHSNSSANSAYSSIDSIKAK